MSQHEDVLIFSNGVVNHVSLSPQNRMTYNPQGVRKCSRNTGGNPNSTPTQLRETKHTNTKRKFRNTYGTRPSNKKEFISLETGYPSDVLYFDTIATFKKIHPTQKPVVLCEYLIRTYTNEGETILDNCIGSGTTAVAAINTGGGLSALRKMRVILR